MKYQAYGDPEPKVRCPYCAELCCADFVDVGVAMQQCGPYHCWACQASEIGSYDEKRELSEEEERTGWYAPYSEPGSSANVDVKGRHIRHFEVDTLYRQSLGVKPRYDAAGRSLELNHTRSNKLTYASV